MKNNSKNQFNEAIKWCKEGTELAKLTVFYRDEKIGCGCLYEAYKRLGNMEEALFYFERASVIKDSLNSMDVVKKLERLKISKEIEADSIAQEKEKLDLYVSYMKDIQKKDKAKYSH